MPAPNKPTPGGSSGTWGSELNAYLEWVEDEELGGRLSDSALSATIATETVPEGRQLLYKPENMARWDATWRDAINVQKVISAPGDSHWQGNDASNGTDTTSDIPYRRAGLIGQIRRKFAFEFGDPGEGGYQLSDGNRWAKSGTGVQVITTTGPNKTGWRLSGVGTATLTVPAGHPVVRIYGWWEGDTQTAPPTVSVNGGAASVPAGADLTGVSGTGTRRAYYFDVTGPATAQYTVVITAPATKYWDLSYGAALARTDQGIRVDRLALGGGRADSYFRNDNSVGETDLLNTTFGGLRSTKVGSSLVTSGKGADLVMCDFHTNHISVSGQTTNAYTPTKHADYHTRIANYVTNTLGSTYLICVPPPWLPSGVGAIPEADFIAAVKAIADTNANVSVFDVTQHPSFQSHDAMVAAGLKKSDGHMYREGHTLYAALLMQALTNRP